MKQQDIKPKNNNGQKHGLWISHFNNKSLYYKGYFINGVRYGHWIYNLGRSPQITLYIK